MSIFISNKKYDNFINSNKIKSEDSIAIISRLNIVEKLLMVTIIGMIIGWILLFLAENSNVWVSIFIFSIIPLFIISVLSKYHSNKLVQLDKIIFDNFLINKVKIFYSNEEATIISYDKIKHITKRLVDTINPNQIVIELTFDAYQEKAEGLIITNISKNSITAGRTNKGTGSISTKIEENAEAILIKNIQEKEIVKNSYIDNKVDLNYWFELKQKGAISEDEFKQKKKELL